MTDRYEFSVSARELPAPFRDINVMSAGNGLFLPMHSHTWYHINHICSGEVIVGFGEEMHTVTAGCTFVLPPYQPHSIETVNGYLQIGLNIAAGEDPRGIAEELRIRSGDTFAVVHHQAAVQPEEMRALLGAPTRRNLLRAQNLAEGLLLDAMDAMQAGESDAFIRDFSRMLEQHAPWTLRLADMCRILCLSRTQLERLSARAFGCGAAEYCARLRYQRVCGLLRTEMTLDAVAHETGFVDAAHLSRFFSARAGMPPGRFRSRGE